jgi:hypothetical protein
MLIVVRPGHRMLFPDSTEAGQFRGEVFADLDGGRDEHGAEAGGSSISSCVRGSRRKIAYFTRSRVVET